MPAPIPNTCPDINAVQGTIEEQSKILSDALYLLEKEEDPTDYVKDAISKINDVIYNLDPLFCVKKYNWHRDNPLEQLRLQNETLRSYGQDMEEEKNIAEARVSELEARVYDLETEIENLQNQQND